MTFNIRILLKAIGALVIATVVSQASQENSQSTAARDTGQP
jgi:hypothetical protein